MNSQRFGLATCKFLLTVAGLGLLLLGLVKLTDQESFLATIHAHGLMPEWSTTAASYAIPLAESVLGAATLWAITTSNRATALAALGLSGFMLLMTIYAAALWISPPPVPVSCGCLPNAAPVESWMPITLRNGTIASAAALIARALINSPAHTQQARPVTT